MSHSTETKWKQRVSVPTNVLSEPSKLLRAAPSPPPTLLPSSLLNQPWVECSYYNHIIPRDIFSWLYSILSLPICPALAPDQSEVLPPRKECPELEKCFDPHCKEKSGQQTCDGLVSCYWCERDKDDVTLAKPYCGGYEHCFRGKETPDINGNSAISLLFLQAFIHVSNWTH